MRKLLIYTFLVSTTGFISINTKAQFKFNLEKQLPQIALPDFTPKSLYVDQYLKRSSLLAKTDAHKISGNNLFDFYELPLDNMICQVPSNQVKCLIKVYNPQTSSTYYPENIPNALLKVELIK